MENVTESVDLRTTLRSELPLLGLAVALTLLSLVGLAIPYLGINFGAAGFMIGLPFLIKPTWDAVRQRQVNAELTMLISGIGAMVLQQFSAAAIISLMTIVMHIIEEATTWRGSRDLSDLAKSAPSFASRLNSDNSVRRVPADSLVPGDIVVVKQGESIPVDGSVVDGEASVTESTLTGEPLPVNRQRGSQVLAGTQVSEGYLKVRVEKPSGQSYIQSLIREVKESVEQRPPMRKFVNLIALYFMPLILVLTVIAFVLTRSAVTAIAMLVIASPCAVLTATPLAFLAVSAKLSKKGIVIKNGEVLRKISRVDTVLLDKTGTVTLGRPTVEHISSFVGDSSRQILSLAASCEIPSPHPIANAIVRHAGEEGVGLTPLDDFKSEVGQGVIGKVNGRTYYLGQASWLAGMGVKFDNASAEALKEIECDSGVSVVLADEKQSLGVIHLDDELKDSATSAIRRLKESGVKQVVLLTGDRREAAESIASKLGISFRAELSPDEKLEIVKELRTAGHIVAFVGDGINDTPAMAESDVSIAVALDGSSLASRVGDVILTGENLEALPDLIINSRRAINAVYQNIAIFLGANAGGLVLAGFGLITPLIGAVVHAIQETFGFVNSSRLAK